MSKFTYKKSGVDIKRADVFTKVVRDMFAKKGAGGVLAFGSIFELSPILKKCKKPLLVSSTDGVGTKLKVAQELNIHNTIGIDLVAMNVNDIVCLGAKPLFFLDYIACGKLKTKVLLEIIKGMNKGLRESDCKLLGGETAEMPGMYSTDEYDLAGFCVGVVDKNNLIDGSSVKKGNLVIGIESSGLHSNGFSLARIVFLKRKLRKYYKSLLTPTRIYVKPVLSLLDSLSANKQKPIKGIAHVTGGSFYEKITKILPSGLGMVINKDSWKVPKIFRGIQEEGCINQKEMYTVFNMGIGMVLVVDKKYAKKAVSFLNKTYPTRIIGEVVASKKRMVIL